MRLATLVPIMLLMLTGIAHAFGPKATGADWAEDFEGSERHRAWAREWAGGPPADFLLETCLDHITTDEDGKVPPRVAKTSLVELTVWCRVEMAPLLESKDNWNGIYFRYPEGMSRRDMTRDDW